MGSSMKGKKRERLSLMSHVQQLTVHPTMAQRLPPTSAVLSVVVRRVVVPPQAMLQICQVPTVPEMCLTASIVFPLLGLCSGLLMARILWTGSRRARQEARSDVLPSVASCCPQFQTIEALVSDG